MADPPVTARSPSASAYVALGANLGRPRDMFRRALAHLESRFVVRITACSPLYRSAAVGGPSDQPDYLNAVTAVDTTLPPADLLAALLDTERYFGRRRLTPNGPRRIDLDLLLYGNQVIDRPDLIVPHPRMHTRRFVLRPLADIAPNLLHPVLQESIAALLARLPEDPAVEIEFDSMASTAGTRRPADAP